MMSTKNISNSELIAWSKQRTLDSAMSQRNGLDSWSNYVGSREFSDWIMVYSQTRDSETLARCNFECILEDLGGEQDGKVAVRRVGHWACGWVETIMVNPADLKLLGQAFDIHKALESYPVFDESRFSEMEYDEFSEYAESEKTSLASDLLELFGLEEDEFREEFENFAYYLNMMTQEYSGGEGTFYVGDTDLVMERMFSMMSSCVAEYRHILDENLVEFIESALNISK